MNFRSLQVDDEHLGLALLEKFVADTPGLAQAGYNLYPAYPTHALGSGTQKRGGSRIV